MAVAAIILSYSTDIDSIERALISVLIQTHPVDEIYIMESGHRVVHNDLKDLVELYGGVTKFKMCTSYTASQARNYGAMLTRSEYICFLDADDQWSPHMIEDRIPLLEDEDVIMATSVYAIQKPDESLEFIRPNFTTRKELFGHNSLGPTSYMLMRRSAFEEAGKFDVYLSYKQDWDLWSRMVKLGKVAISPALGGIRYNNNFSIAHNGEKARAGWNQFINKHHGIYLRYRDEAESVRKEFEEAMKFCRARHYNIFGPIGMIQRHIFDHLPRCLCYYYNVDEEDWGRLVSKREWEEMCAKAEAEKEPKEPEKPWSEILFKKSRGRCPSVMA